MKHRTILVSLVATLIPSAALAAAAPVCRDPSTAAGFSTEHVGPSGIPGAMLDLVLSDDGSTGVGVLQLSQDPTDSVFVRLTADGTRLHTYDVTIPCNPALGAVSSTGTDAWSFRCDPLTSLAYALPVTTAKGVVKPAVDWVGSLKVSFDADDDVLVAKLVQTIGLNGVNSMCGQLWYMAGSVPSQPTNCLLDSDCTDTTQPLPDLTSCKPQIGYYGGVGGVCGDPPPQYVRACSGTVQDPSSGASWPWSWNINASNLSCLSVDGASLCTQGNMYLTPVDGSTWTAALVGNTLEITYSMGPISDGWNVACN